MQQKIKTLILSKQGNAVKKRKFYRYTYTSWQSMKQRCLAPKHEQYKNYGARGITICDRWLHSFENFLEDMGERPKGKTLGRLDSNGNYEKNNCKWQTSLEQGQHKRNNQYLTLGNTTLTFAQWARRLKVSYAELYEWATGGSLKFTLGKMIPKEQLDIYLAKQKEYFKLPVKIDWKKDKMQEDDTTS